MGVHVSEAQVSDRPLYRPQTMDSRSLHLRQDLRGLPGNVQVRLWLMAKPRQSAIALAKGAVEVRGRVVARRLLRSPISMREGVGLRIAFGSDWQWTRTRTTIDVVEDFLVDDGTGQALVVGLDAEISVSVRRSRPFRVDEPTHELVRLLERAGATIADLFGRSLLVAREYLLLPETLVIVRGNADIETVARGVQGGYRVAPSVLALRGSLTAPLCIIPAGGE